jgi:hypothetical protein
MKKNLRGSILVQFPFCANKNNRTPGSSYLLHFPSCFPENGFLIPAADTPNRRRSSCNNSQLALRTILIVDLLRALRVLNLPLTVNLIVHNCLCSDMNERVLYVCSAFDPLTTLLCSRIMRDKKEKGV